MNISLPLRKKCHCACKCTKGNQKTDLAGFIELVHELWAAYFNACMQTPFTQSDSYHCLIIYRNA